MIANLRPLGLLIVAAAGLAVGVALTTAWTWQPAGARGAAARRPDAAPDAPATPHKPSVEPALLPPVTPGSNPLAAAIRAPTGRFDAPAVLTPRPVALAPMGCFDADRRDDLPVCGATRLLDDLTIDHGWQDRIAGFLRARPLVAAAFVAIDVDTGEVRALLSREPDARRVADEAFRADAPAASVYKIVTAAALLERGVSAKTAVAFHGGERRIELEHLRDHRRDNRKESLHHAFAHSRNAVFAKLAAQRLRPKHFQQAAVALGFNGTLPFEYPLDPSTAEIPTGKLQRARMAAGFRAVRLNPVHAALIAGTVARGGTFPLPRLYRSAAPDVAPEAERVLDDDVARSLKRMMRATVRRGTGSRTLGDARHRTAAKSGSLSSWRDGRLRHHSWMVGFFPYRRPKVAFAALVVNDPETWHIKAGELARFAVDSWDR